MKSLKLLSMTATLAVSMTAAAQVTFDTPAPVTDVISATPFTLNAGYQFMWRAEQPVVHSGYLLVLKVDTDLVKPTQLAQPVLYVGHQTAELLNMGNESGHIVALVPAPLDKDGNVALDLTRTPIWFGTPNLPEQVDEATIKAEYNMAMRSGIKAMPARNIVKAMQRGGSTIDEANMTNMLDEVAELIDIYSPQEADLADQYMDAANAG